MSDESMTIKYIDQCIVVEGKLTIPLKDFIKNKKTPLESLLSRSVREFEEQSETLKDLLIKKGRADVHCGFTKRALLCFHNNNFLTIDDLVRNHEDKLMKDPKFGKSTLKSTQNTLNMFGLSLGCMAISKDR